MSAPAGVYLWLGAATTREPRPDALASVTTTPLDDGPPLRLSAWAEDARPRGVRVAKVAAGAIDPEGAPARVSLVLVPRGVRVPFDDQAVIQARRAALTHWPWRAMSTLVRQDSEFAGAIAATPPDSPPQPNPFSRIAPARLLLVPEGLIGSMPPPAGPVLERYGSAKPWPLDRF